MLLQYIIGLDDLNCKKGSIAVLTPSLAQLREASILLRFINNVTNMHALNTQTSLPSPSKMLISQIHCTGNEPNRPLTLL